MVIVDQHAARERLVYERMKKALEADGITRQMLLIPEVVDLDEASVERLAARAEEFAELGLVLEPFGGGAVVVREIPALMGEADRPTSAIWPTNLQSSARLWPATGLRIFAAPSPVMVPCAPGGG